MSKIVIDARELRTSTGRYVERLLNYLQDIDHVNDYVILLKPKDIPGWRTKNEHFVAVECPHEEFSFTVRLALKSSSKRSNQNLSILAWSSSRLCTAVRLSRPFTT